MYKGLVFEVEQSTPYEVRLMVGERIATIHGEPVVNWDGHWQFAVYASDVGRWDDGTAMTADERATALALLRERGTRLD